MTIYIDVIWLLNFFIDLILIWLTAFALKRLIKKWRLILAAFFASSIVFFLFTPLATFFYHPLGKVVFSALIIYIAFGFRHFAYFLQNFFMFYFITFVIGGGLFAFHYFWQPDEYIWSEIMTLKSTSFGSPVSWLFVIIALPFLIFFTKQQFQQVETRKMAYERTVTVEIQIAGRTITATGLVDSGNQLYDPLTKAPVMILEQQCLTQSFPELLTDDCFNIDRLLMLKETEKQHPFYAKLRIIPYKVIGSKHNYLVAIKPDKVTIYDGSQKYEISKVLIGIESMKLSNDGDYEAIIHPQMLLKPA